MGFTIFIQLLVMLTTPGTDYKTAGLAKAQCTDCHENIISGKYMHPDLSSSCDLCHNPTGEEHPGSGSKGYELSDQIPELCYMCHDRLNTMQMVHYPVSEGDCMVCHSPHSTNRKSLLLDQLSENICLDCHDVSVSDTKSTHQPFNSGNCLACHHVHQSDQAALINKNGAELCLSCHKSIISRNISVHAPAESGDCQLCHQAHASIYNKLLTADYPGKLYTSASIENFELCFTCHDSKLISEEITEYSTNFRDRNRNLHFTHITGEKGHSCSICHEIHSSNAAPLIRDKIPFGNWEMRLSFSPTENGGTCNTACHSQKSYSRE